MFEPLRHKSRAAALDCQLEAAWSQVLPEHRRESMPLIIEQRNVSPEPRRLQDRLSIIQAMSDS
jgi:hypothetical protein